MDNNLSNFSPLHSSKQKRGWRPHWRDMTASLQLLREAPSLPRFGKTGHGQHVPVHEGGLKLGRIRQAEICNKLLSIRWIPIQKQAQKLSDPPKVKVSFPKSHLYSCCFLLAASTFKPCYGSLYPCWDAFRDTLLGSTRHEADSVLYYLIKA